MLGTGWTEIAALAAAFVIAVVHSSVTSLRSRTLVADPGLAQATNPAVDVLDITPVEHAVAGGQAGALRLILDHIAHPLPGGVRALRGAAAQGSLAMAELLLALRWDASGSAWDAGSFTPGSLRCQASRGAAIDSSGSWIGAVCTGNQGRKDDPDYVRALLHYGARAPIAAARLSERCDRRPGAQRDGSALRG